MKAHLFWAFLGTSILIASPLLADEPASDAPKPAATDGAKDGPKDNAKKDPFAHTLQFGFRAGLVGGYNMIFRYDQSPLCTAYQNDKLAKDQQKVCGHGAPAALDLALSFAPLDFVEPYLFMRLGLAGENQTDTLPLKVFGAGARIYTMSDSAFKIFVEPAVGLEFEKGGTNPSFHLGNPSYKNDLLIHLAVGPQLDFAKYVGVFVDAGLTTGVLRAIHTELELQGGVQARFP